MDNDGNWANNWSNDDKTWTCFVDIPENAEEVNGEATIIIGSSEWTGNPSECYHTIDLAGNPIDMDGNPANGYQPPESVNQPA